MAPGDSQEEDRDPILKHKGRNSAHQHVNSEEMLSSRTEGSPANTFTAAL